MGRSKDLYGMLEDLDEGDEKQRHQEQYLDYKREALATFLEYPKEVINPTVINNTTFEFGGKRFGIYFVPEVNNIERSGRNLKMILVHTNISVFIEVLKDGREEGSS